MTRQNTPRCPRCGYDQSGSVATWTDSCPCRGTCPECGLDFRWLDIFHPDRERIRGFFEHARGLRQLALAIPRTASLIARPWRFWRIVELRMSPRLWRALAFLVLFLLSVQVTRVALGAAHVGLKSAASGTPTIARTGLSEYKLLAWECFPPWNASPWWGLWKFDLPDWWGRGPSLLLASTPLWLLSFALLPETRRRSKVRLAHLMRAFIYSWSWTVMLLMPWIVQYGPWFVIDLCELFGLQTPGFIREIAFSADNLDWTLISSYGGFDLWMTVAAWSWLAAWWFFAIRRGFRLPHAWGVWAALAIINLLGSVLLLAMWTIAVTLIANATQ